MMITTLICKSVIAHCSLQPCNSVYFSKTSFPIQCKKWLLHITTIITCHNATQYTDLIHKLERRFAGNFIFCLARPLAFCLTLLIVFIWGLTLKPQADFNNKTCSLSTFCRLGLQSFALFLLTFSPFIYYQL